MYFCLFSVPFSVCVVQTVSKQTGRVVLVSIAYDVLNVSGKTVVQTLCSFLEYFWKGNVQSLSSHCLQLFKCCFFFSFEFFDAFHTPSETARKPAGVRRHSAVARSKRSALVGTGTRLLVPVMHLLKAFQVVCTTFLSLRRRKQCNRTTDSVHLYPAGCMHARKLPLSVPTENWS